MRAMCIGKASTLTTGPVTFRIPKEVRRKPLNWPDGARYLRTGEQKSHAETSFGCGRRFSMKQIALRLPDEDAKTLEAVARKNRSTVSQVIRQAIVEYLEYGGWLNRDNPDSPFHGDTPRRRVRK
jgi:hypothetical protein